MCMCNQKLPGTIANRRNVSLLPAKQAQVVSSLVRCVIQPYVAAIVLLKCTCNPCYVIECAGKRAPELLETDHETDEKDLDGNVGDAFSPALPADGTTIVAQTTTNANFNEDAVSQLGGHPAAGA